LDRCARSSHQASRWLGNTGTEAYSTVRSACKANLGDSFVLHTNIVPNTNFYILYICDPAYFSLATEIEIFLSTKLLQCPIAGAINFSEFARSLDSGHAVSPIRSEEGTGLARQFAFRQWRMCRCQEFRFLCASSSARSGLCLDCLTRPTSLVRSNARGDDRLAEKTSVSNSFRPVELLADHLVSGVSRS
jgi:hypothetical protein